MGITLRIGVYTIYVYACNVALPWKHSLYDRLKNKKIDRRF